MRDTALLYGQGETERDTRLRSDCGQNRGTQQRAIEPEAAVGYEAADRFVKYVA